METRTYPQTLFETAQRILEQAAFALPDLPEDEIEQARAVAVACKVQFTGLFSGEMCFQADEHLARIMAANMLGIDENDPDAAQKRKDAVGEILNMICGNFLPLVAGTRAEFKIGAPVEIPEEVFDDLVAHHPEELLTDTELSLEGGCRARLALLLDEPPGGAS